MEPSGGLTEQSKRFILSGSSSDGSRSGLVRLKRRDGALTNRPKWFKVKGLLDAAAGRKAEKRIRRGVDGRAVQG